MKEMGPIISSNIRIRVPDAFDVGRGSIIDDYCYFSTQIKIGEFCHIANNVSIAGGAVRRFSLGNFSSVSAGARIWCSSDDFQCDMAALIPAELHVEKNTVTGDVELGELTIVGCNSVIMPGNSIPEGVAIGALSFVPPHFAFEDWGLYAGTPIRFIRKRNRNEIVRQKKALIEQLNSNIE